MNLKFKFKSLTTLAGLATDKMVYRFLQQLFHTIQVQ